MKNRFLQLHLLTSYPPANLNRDDLGRPKTAMMGGAIRLRVSSQSLKRAWRTSDVFESSLANNLGKRTKEMGRHVAKQLLNADVPEKLARASARKIAEVFGKPEKAKDDKSKDALDIAQLAHFSPSEIAAIDELVKVIAQEGREPNEDELHLLGKAHGASDIALFGRMLASAPAHNVEAAAQVAHAIGVHKSAIEDDFFTAVDDLNDGQNDLGAAHMGETEFGAGLFYLYICIDKAQLHENLGNDLKLTADTINSLLECAATVSPTGKQNSFASRAYASYVMAEKGNRQPRSLSVAFLKPVGGFGEGMLDNAIASLEKCRDSMDNAYGSCADSRAIMNVPSGEGSLQSLIEFSSAE